MVGLHGVEAKKIHPRITLAPDVRPPRHGIQFHNTVSGEESASMNLKISACEITALPLQEGRILRAGME